MFRAVSRPIVQACVCLQRRTPPIISSSACRNLSLISVHKSFPASLLRLSPRQESGLFDCSKKMDGLHDPDDGVLISKDGWVYPAVLESPLSAQHYASDHRRSLTTQRSIQRHCIQAKYLHNARNCPTIR